MNKLDTALLVGLGLSQETAKIVMDEISMLRKDVQALKDGASYREEMVEQLKSERQELRDCADKLVKRMTWFVGFTEGMMSTEHVGYVLEEINEGSRLARKPKSR